MLKRLAAPSRTTPKKAVNLSLDREWLRAAKELGLNLSSIAGQALAQAILRFQDHDLVAMVPELAGVPVRGLGSVVGEPGSARNEVPGALDLLPAGF